MQDEPKSTHNFFLVSLILGCLVAIGSAFYFLYYQKDYYFIVETSCDSAVEECFIRDCSDPELCPPNGLSSFKRYGIKASDFDMCTNEDCTMACETGAIECEQEACVEDVEYGESCVAPSPVEVPVEEPMMTEENE